MYEKILEYLQTADDATVVNAWNEYCRDNCYEDELYSMDEFDELMEGKTASEVVEMVRNGGGDGCCGNEFCYHDDYFMFTIYGVKSIDYPFKVVDIIAVAEWITETENDCGDREIRDILRSEE